MSTTLVRSRINPAFKLVQRLPELIVSVAASQNGEPACRARAVVPSRSARINEAKHSLVGDSALVFPEPARPAGESQELSHD